VARRRRARHTALARVMRPMRRRRRDATVPPTVWRRFAPSSGTQLANVGRQYACQPQAVDRQLLRTVAQQAWSSRRRAEERPKTGSYPSAVAIRAPCTGVRRHKTSRRIWAEGAAQAFPQRNSIVRPRLCTRRLVLLKPFVAPGPRWEPLRLSVPPAGPLRDGRFRASDRLSSRWPHGSSRAEVLQFSIFRTGT